MSGFLRITKPSEAMVAAFESDVSTNHDSYLTRLVKLIPAEIQTLYATGIGLIGKADAFSGWWSAICLAILIGIRAKATMGPGKTPQWPAIGIACVSFGLWVYVIGGSFVGLPLPVGTERYVSLAMFVWTAVLPYFYQGEASDN